MDKQHWRPIPAELSWRYDKNAKFYPWQVTNKCDQQEVVAGMTTEELRRYLSGKTEKLDARRIRVFKQLNRDNELAKKLLKKQLCD